jgi:hypothetical protein
MRAILLGVIHLYQKTLARTLPPVSIATRPSLVTEPGAVGGWPSNAFAVAIRSIQVATILYPNLRRMSN